MSKKICFLPSVNCFYKHFFSLLTFDFGFFVATATARARTIQSKTKHTLKDFSMSS